MKRSDLVKAVALANPGYSHQKAERLVVGFFEIIAKHLADGGRVEIRGFGVFETRDRGCRIGRNPRTGHQVEVQSKRVPFFKPGKDVRDLVIKTSEGSKR